MEEYLNTIEGLMEEFNKILICFKNGEEGLQSWCTVLL